MRPFSQGKECEDLLALVRELTESRSQLTAFKAIQGERFEDLQQECLRLVRVAELCRAVSKENLVKFTETTKKLNQVSSVVKSHRIHSHTTAVGWFPVKLRADKPTERRQT